jgi:hypothetical protein
MNRLTFLGGKLALAAALLLGVTGIASATLIDDFSTDQASIVRVGSDAGTTTTSVTGPGIIGDWRDLSVTIPGAAGEPTLQEAEAGVSFGSLNIGNDPGVSSIVTVAWDGAGVGAGASGLGAAGDLSTAIAILVNVISADLNVTIDFDLTDVNDAVSSASKTVSAGLVNFAKGDFSGSADWSQLRSIVMTVNGPAAYDVQIELVEGSDVPEPATLFLSGGVLLALGLFRKRFAKVA